MRKIRLNLVLVLFAAILAIVSCKKDDSGSSNLIEDGGYIVGGSTLSSDLDLKGMMSAGLVEGEGYAATPRAGMYEKFTFISSTGDGFHFVVKAGAEEVVYGLKASSKGTITFDASGESDQIKNAVVDTGAVEIDGANITVATSGFYHIVLDVTTMAYYVIPVNNWSIKLAEDLELTAGTISATGATWSKTSVELRKGTYKFRYDHGWKVYANKGKTNQFIIFTNLGGTTSSLSIGGSNIAMALADEGKYTVTLKWNPTAGFTMTLTDKVAVVPVDPATFVWSLIGNAFYKADGTTVADWNYDVDLPYLSKAGNVYTYKVNSVQLLAGGSFKIRKDHAWAGGDFGFSGTTIAGDASNFTDDGGNIKVTATKTYSVTYELDWANDTRKLTFTVLTK